MYRGGLVSVLVFVAGIAAAFQEDFNDTTFSAGIPANWKLDAKHITTSSTLFTTPETVGGRKSLTLNFYSASQGYRIIYNTNTLENVECDNICVSVPVFLQKERTAAKIDQCQVVVSTNNFETYEHVGNAFNIQELNLLDDKWVTNKVSQYIEGLSSCDVLVGLKFIAAGSSRKSGYVGGIVADLSRRPLLTV